MVRMMMAILAFSAVCAMPRLAAAQQEQTPLVFDMETLMSMCAAIVVPVDRFDPSEAVTAPACQMYVLGVRQGFEDAQFMVGREDSAFCTGSARPRDQAQAVYLWLRAHPSRWQRFPSLSVLAALAEVYPCPAN